MTGLRRALVLTVLVAAGGPGAPAVADWLVLRDGGAVQTDGAWEVKGRVVVFHRANGKLASMRLSEVDIEASHRRTVAAKAPRQEPRRPAEQPREVMPVLVVTDADVAHVDPADFQRTDPAEVLEQGGAEGIQDSDGEEEGAAARTTRDGRAEPAGAVEVTDWNRIDDMKFPGSRIGGTIRNNSEAVAIGIAVTARLTGEDGQEVGRERAVLGRLGLEPGASTSFEVDFSGVYSYFGIDFEVQSFDAVRRSQGEE